jgi:hypothetical protein
MMGDSEKHAEALFELGLSWYARRQDICRSQMVSFGRMDSWIVKTYNSADSSWGGVEVGLCTLNAVDP